MGTKIRTVPEAAGVKCPKDTGKMDRDASCKGCEYYHRCLGQVGRALGVPH